jgi:hypothetical protein
MTFDQALFVFPSAACICTWAVLVWCVYQRPEMFPMPEEGNGPMVFAAGLTAGSAVAGLLLWGRWGWGVFS